MRAAGVRSSAGGGRTGPTCRSASTSRPIASCRSRSPTCSRTHPGRPCRGAVARRRPGGEGGRRRDQGATQRRRPPGARAVGMRERVAGFGGPLAPGREPGGGFEVHAPIPFGEEVSLIRSPSSTTRRWCVAGSRAAEVRPGHRGRRGGRRRRRAVALVRTPAARRRAHGHPHARHRRARGDPRHHGEPGAEGHPGPDPDDVRPRRVRLRGVAVRGLGFLLKDALPEDLLAAVRVVAAGDSLLAPRATRRLIEEFVARPAATAVGPPRRGELAGLTDRERESWSRSPAGCRTRRSPQRCP